MHATYFLVLLPFWSLTKDENSFETLEVTDNPCEESHVCIPRESCSSYNESIAKLRILPKTEFLLEVRKLFCNKEKRGVCCLAEDGEPDDALQSNESQMEDDDKENEEYNLELNPPSLLSGPRPKWGPRASKCCK